MMLFRTVFCLLSIVATATILGGAVAPSQTLALNYPGNVGQLKAASKDNQQVFEKLGLSASQINKVRAIYEQYEPEIISRRQAIMAAKNELKSLAPNQYQDKQQRIDTLKQELAVIKSKYASAVQAVLTTEQWSKLQKLRKER
jgi:Spy/CpxP family protein refolding chaperone